MRRLLILAFAAFAIAAVAFPSLLTRIAGLVGVGRGTDLLLYATVMVLLGHIQERIVDAYAVFRRAVEFLPVEDASSQESGGGKTAERTFMTPDAVRALFRDLR